MSAESFKITIHMVSSLDGFIAKKDNSISWFETSDYYDKGVEISKQDMDKFLQSIHCYVMGSKTYEHAIKLSKSYGWTYGEVPTFVLTQRTFNEDRKHIHFFSGSLNDLVNNHLKPNYKNVWLVGGAMLVKDFIHLKLADEIRLSVLPIILGDGLLFFNHIQQEQTLHLKDVTAYKNGMVELCYEIKKQ